MHVNSQREIPLFLPPASEGWGSNVSSLSVHRKVPRSLVPGPFWGYPSLWSCPGWGYLKARTGVRPPPRQGYLFVPPQRASMIGRRGQCASCFQQDVFILHEIAVREDPTKILIKMHGECQFSPHFIFCTNQLEWII